MSTTHVWTPERLDQLRKRTKGCAGRRKGQCALCHGIEAGNRPQRFPVQKGVIPIAGLLICRTHGAVLEEIAADAGITWVAIPRKI